MYIMIYFKKAIFDWKIWFTFLGVDFFFLDKIIICNKKKTELIRWYFQVGNSVCECECILHVHIYILSLYRGINASYLCQFTDVTGCRDVQCNFYMFMYFWWFTHLPNKLKTPGEILEGCKNPFKDVSVRAARSNTWNYLLWLFLVNKEMAVTVVSSSFILSVCNHERYLYPLISSSLSQ